MSPNEHIFINELFYSPLKASIMKNYVFEVNSEKNSFLKVSKHCIVSSNSVLNHCYINNHNIAMFLFHR